MAGFLSKFKKKDQPVRCAAVVVAAGSARRMEGIDKILTNLGGLPVLVRTLRAFQNCSSCNEIVVVTREDLLVEVSRLCKEYGLDKVTKVIVGGTERIHSVRAGIQEVSERTQLVAIHDGARPLVSQDLLNETIRKAAETGAAAPAIPMVDTIKKAVNGLTVETIDRSQLWAVQTPQVFEFGLIAAALEQAVKDGETLTDDCAAVERLGMKVSLTSGSRNNIKITTPFDLILGEAILDAEIKGALS